MSHKCGVSLNRTSNYEFLYRQTAYLSARDVPKSSKTGMDPADVVGNYQGTYHVREGREDELTKDEVKRYLKSKEDLDLEVRPDGTFSHKGVTSGVWSTDGQSVSFQPTSFGRQTHDEMRRAAEEAGRVFTLAFLFEPFVLRWDGEAFVTPGDDTLIYTVYRRK